MVYSQQAQTRFGLEKLVQASKYLLLNSINTRVLGVFNKHISWSSIMGKVRMSWVCSAIAIAFSLFVLGVPASGQGVASIITENVFNDMLKHRNDAACLGKNFYTYSAFIAAANAFSGFGTTGDSTTQKRELAAFFGQTSHETTGGWATAPDGPYAWGYCLLREQKMVGKYYGRGPIQLTGDYNYRAAGNAIGFDGINNPDIVAQDPVISFKTAIWFWMTAQSPKPSCHDVITGRWTPSGSDNAAGRVAGYGMTTNIINGGLECGAGSNPKMEDRIGFYKRYCDMMGVGYGPNLDCSNQKHYKT